MITPPTSASPSWRTRRTGIPTRTELSVAIVDYGAACKHGDTERQAAASRELAEMMAALYRRINGMEVAR